MDVFFIESNSGRRSSNPAPSKRAFRCLAILAVSMFFSFLLLILINLAIHGRGVQRLIHVSPLAQPRADLEHVCHSEECAYTSSRLKNFLNSSVDLCEDFYSYACGKYKNNFTLSTYDSVVTSPFEEASENVLHKIKEIMDNIADEEQSSAFRKAAVLYKSCLDADKQKNESLIFIQKIFEASDVPWPYIDENSGPEYSWLNIVAKMEKHYIHTLFEPKFSSSGNKQSRKIEVDCKFPLLKSKYYLKPEDTTNEHVLNAYKDIISAVLVNFKVDEKKSEKIASDIVYLETELAEALQVDSEKNPGCFKYKTCGECVKSENKECEWCFIENRCRNRNGCSKAPANSVAHWLNNTENCPKLTDISPSQVQKAVPKIINLKVANFKSIDELSSCTFTAFGTFAETGVVSAENSIRCAVPKLSITETNNTEHHFFTARLAVKTIAGADVAATNLTFFNCSSYNSCTECVLSPFPCTWCVIGVLCTHDFEENCRNDRLVTGISFDGPSIRSGPQFCNRILPQIENQIEIFVPSGLKKRINIRARIQDMIIANTGFVCQFTVEGKVHNVGAQFLGNTMYCEAFEFSYEAELPNVTAFFTVLQAGRYPLDNPDNIHVIIYKCKFVGPNCQTCLNLPDVYTCGWCIDHHSCETPSECDWSGFSEYCSDSEILANQTTLTGDQISDEKGVSGQDIPLESDLSTDDKKQLRLIWKDVLEISPEIESKCEENMHEAMKVLNNAPTSTVLNYIGWRVVSQLMLDVSRKLKKLKTNFEDEKGIPSWRECAKILKENMGFAVANAFWNANYFTSKQHKEIQNMFLDLKNAFRFLLTMIKWLDKNTTDAFTKKLLKMKLDVGHFKIIKNNTKVKEIYKNLHFKENGSFVANMMKFRSFLGEEVYTKFRQTNNSSRKMLYSLEHSPLGTSSRYGYTTNRIDMDLGLFLSPLYEFGPEYPKYLKYAQAALIARELSYAFDPIGNLYDQDGNFRGIEWWPDVVKLKFHNFVTCLSEQNAGYFPTHEFEHTLAIKENIADLGAFFVTYSSLLLHLGTNTSEPVLPDIKFNKQQTYFLQISQLFCEAQQSEDLPQEKVYLSGKYRVNNAISNMMNFGIVFGCTEGTPMNPERKCNLLS